LTGIQEILTLILIIAGIIVLPRIFKKEKTGKTKKRKLMLSGTFRMGIVVSILIPVISALILRPWQRGHYMFILTGILPVALGWGVAWIISGFRKKER